MTTSESSLTAMNAASQLLTNSTSKNQPINIAEQAISGLTTLGGNFSTLFSGAQQANDSMSQQSLSAEDKSISIIQQSVFSSLGLGNMSNGTDLITVDTLTSQSSIEFMQTSLLTALQTSVFSAQPKKNTPVDKTSNTINENNAEISNAKSSDSHTVHKKKSTTNNVTSDSSDTTAAKSNIEISGKTNYSNITANKNNAETTQYPLMNSLLQLSLGEDGFDSKDGFDIVNVLQHIPIVSAFYQDVTGQDISGISKLSGGFLYGGPLGLAISALDLAIEGYSGSSMNDALRSFDYAGLFSSENEDQ